jgi:hypothetical protein
MSIGLNFLESAEKEFGNYKSLAERTFAQLKDEDFYYQPNETCNSIAINIQHMHGNMVSRWTNFLTEDGEKEWRQRDGEFEVKQLTREQLELLWDEGWRALFEALKPLEKKDLKKTIHIRQKPLTVIEAINRQLAHYSYHVGQIVLLGKCVKGAEWENLSVPKKK